MIRTDVLHNLRDQREYARKENEERGLKEAREEMEEEADKNKGDKNKMKKGEDGEDEGVKREGGTKLPFQCSGQCGIASCTALMDTVASLRRHIKDTAINSIKYSDWVSNFFRGR